MSDVLDRWGLFHDVVAISTGNRSLARNGEVATTACTAYVNYGLFGREVLVSQSIVPHLSILMSNPTSLL